VDLEQHTCPTCGGPAKLLYQTVMIDGIRTPVEPVLSCPLGHEPRLAGRDHEPRDARGGQVTDTELIG
jgi:hypothetical protein